LATITDTNKRMLDLDTAYSDDGTGYGPYRIKVNWKHDDAAKVATVEYTIKKDGKTILSDTSELAYETALMRELENGNSLRLWTTTNEANVTKFLTGQDQ
jgi:hypothetical protein